MGEGGAISAPGSERGAKKTHSAERSLPRARGRGIECGPPPRVRRWNARPRGWGEGTHGGGGRRGGTVGRGNRPRPCAQKNKQSPRAPRICTPTSPLFRPLTIRVVRRHRGHKRFQRGRGHPQVRPHKRGAVVAGGGGDARRHPCGQGREGRARGGGHRGEGGARARAGGTKQKQSPFREVSVRSCSPSLFSKTRCGAAVRVTNEI